jgi:hypothetical protein
MCVVSAIGDYYRRDTLPNIIPNYTPGTTGAQVVQFATKQDLIRIEQSLIELKSLLLQAIKYDKMMNEPHCEHEDKVRLIKELADAVGVDMTDVFK